MWKCQSCLEKVPELRARRPGTTVVFKKTTKNHLALPRKVLLPFPCCLQKPWSQPTLPGANFFTSQVPPLPAKFCGCFHSPSFFHTYRLHLSKLYCPSPRKSQRTWWWWGLPCNARKRFRCSASSLKTDCCYPSALTPGPVSPTVVLTLLGSC